MNVIHENLEICKKCGGYCCKKCGCDYAAEDFLEIKMNYLLEKLNEGYISIVSAQNFERLKNGKIVNTPFLYLRARNLNRPVVDLLSMKTTCASLTKTGCKFDYQNRPFGGKNLIPVDGLHCYPDKDALNIVKSWSSYQKLLARLVKRLTGKSVEEKLREDVESLFYDLLCNRVEGVLEAELKDIYDMLPILIQTYPTEYLNAQQRYCSCSIRILKK